MTNLKEKFGRVAVVMGGTSAERDVSLNSGAAVLLALQGAGVDAHKFDPKEEDVFGLKAFDRVFNVMHGRGGEDGQLQGFLELLGVPYTGSSIMASAIGMDKVRTKQLWAGAGIQTAPFMMVTKDTDPERVAQVVGFPLIIKPVHEGSSVGMSKVNSQADLASAVETALKFDSEVMAERWISGKEYTVVILKGEAYPVIRLEPALDAEFYDYNAKYKRNDTQYGIPCGLSDGEEKRMQQLCLQAFEVVGAKDWGRIDVMQDAASDFWLLEINTVPGMTDHSLVPMAAAAKGVQFTELCLTLLETTL